MKARARRRNVTVTIANRNPTMPRPRLGALPMTAAERQARRRAQLRRLGDTLTRAPMPRGLPRPRRWAAAVTALMALQDEYRAWLDRLPESLAGSKTADKLQAITELDLHFSPSGLMSNRMVPEAVAATFAPLEAVSCHGMSCCSFDALLYADPIITKPIKSNGKALMRFTSP